MYSHSSVYDLFDINRFDIRYIVHRGCSNKMEELEMKTARRLDFRSRQVRHLEKDAAMLLLWVLVLILMPEPGFVLVTLVIGSMIIANLQKSFFKEDSFMYIFWVTIAILPITLLGLTGFFWYEKILPLFWRNLSGIIGVALTGVALLVLVIDLLFRLFVIRWNKKVIKDLLKKVPA